MAVFAYNRNNNYGYHGSNVRKDYVLDYTSPLNNVIMEYESGDANLTYRYVHGLQKTSVTISGISNGAGSVMQYVYDDEEGEFVLTTEQPGQNIAQLFYGVVLICLIHLLVSSLSVY